MKFEVMKQWVAALRSGKYKQGDGQLRPENDRYCCLGVLCDLKDPDAWKAHDENESFMFGFDGSSEVIPDSVRVWAGLACKNPFVQEDNPNSKHNILSEMNDKGKSFLELADFIEKHWDIL